MSQVTEQSVRFQTALASIKLIQASAVLDLTEDDFDFLTSNKVWIATDRSRARRCVEACVYGTLDFVGYPRFPAPVEFIAAVIASITSIILIKLIRVSLGTVRHPRRFKIVVIDIQITLKQMLRDFIGIRVNRAKKSGMVNITSSVNSRERSGINTILHELNPLFTINVTMRDIKSK